MPHKSNKRKLLFLFLIPLVCVCVFIASAVTNNRQKQNSEMTFEVTIPSNTPTTDTVHIYIAGIEGSRKMSKKSTYVYAISFKGSELTQPGEIIKYRYSRNGYSYGAAEYLEPDTNDYFWTQRGRSAVYKPGKVQQDTVARWRWFPEAGTPIVRTSELEPAGPFLARVNGKEFRTGQVIEDLYNDAYDDFFESTAVHMKNMGYGWAEIDPPWQWTEENGLPVVKNLYETNPNYPTDAKFLEEVRAYKSQGLKVAIQPQICCTEIKTDGRSDAWWDAYFAETTRFLVHFAKLAEQGDADALHYAIGSWDVQHRGRWPLVFKEVRKHFSGEVGQMVWNFAQEPTIIPSEKEITWGNELDYFYIAIDTPISPKDNPTAAELKAGAGRMLDGVKPLYDKYKKPIVVRTTYFNIAQTWRGNSYYSIADPPWYGSEEKELVTGKYRFSNTDQARVVNAYWQAIAERPWVIGYLQFGYSHWENPLASDLSVRGKPSEDIWRKWNLYTDQD